jgi:hypothetical protein
MEEPVTSNMEEEPKLVDPMVLETEETYLQAFDQDEGGRRWLLQLDAEKQKKHAKRSTWRRGYTSICEDEESFVRAKLPLGSDE